MVLREIQPLSVLACKKYKVLYLRRRISTRNKEAERVNVMEQTRLGLETRMSPLQGLGVKIKTRGLRGILLQVIKALLSAAGGSHTPGDVVCVCMLVSHSGPCSLIHIILQMQTRSYQDFN